MSTFFFNREIDKGELRRLVAWHLTNHGRTNTLIMIDKLKTLGFHHATTAGLSLGLEDLKIPPAKQLLLAYAENEVAQADDRFSRGKITAVERSQKILDVWNAASELLKDEVVEYFRETDLLNPVYMMALSGARGNLSQVRQLVGMRGLMSDPQGEIIDLPIKSNFREGLTVTEYIISCYGARKGLVDTALKTANSGYLTRRLVDVAQAVIIKEVDCDTFQGIFLSSLIEQEKVLLPLKTRLIGRVLAAPIKKNRLFLGSRNEDISPELATKIIQFQQLKIYVRSPLTCQTVRHVCKLCYGWSLADGCMVDLGEAIGIIAAQSIGEPGTQLTMRTFHTGGVFSTDVADRIYAPHHGHLSYDLTDSQKIRTPFGQEAVFFKQPVDLVIKEDEVPFVKEPDSEEKKKDTIISLPPYTLVFIKPKTKVYWKQVIAETSDLKTILSGPKSNLGVRALKEVCSASAGSVYFQQVTTISFRADSAIEKLNNNDKIKKNNNDKIKKKKETFDQKETVYIQGKAYFYVLEGKVVPYSSFSQQEIEVEEGDIHLENRNKTNNKFIPNVSYSVSLRPGGIGFRFPNLNLGFLSTQLSTKVEQRLSTLVNKRLFTKVEQRLFTKVKQCLSPFSWSWISGNPTEPFAQIFSGIQTLPLCFTYKHYETAGIHLTKSCLTTSSKLASITNRVSYNLVTTSTIYQPVAKGKTHEFHYCAQPLKGKTTTWSYLPQKHSLPKSARKLKKLLSHNFSLTKSFENVVDDIQFSVPVFVEWQLLIESEEHPSWFRVIFRKQLPLKAFHFVSNLHETSSVSFCSLTRDSFSRKNLADNNQKLQQDHLKNTVLSKPKLNREIEIKKISQQKYCLVESERNQIQYSLNGKKRKVKLGSFVCRGDQISEGLRVNQSGIVSHITKDYIILRKATPYRASNKSLLSVTHDSLVSEGATLFHLVYQKAKTEDIVQGLPKIEELLEARRTKNLQPIPNNSHDKLKELFENYKPIWGAEIAARISLKEIQQFLVNSVQKVYQSQGVDISDKHIEIIVKQMTSRVFIIHGGQTPLIYGDLVELHQITKLNEGAIASGRQRATYEPIILGITKASLTSESFLSAASFQETTRVLTQAAIQGRIDLFRGLKENVLIGNLIPAGTGFLTMSS